MKVTVIGAGSWGTAVAWLLGANGHEVALWTHGQNQADAINTTGRNPRYLDDLELIGVRASSRFEVVLDGTEAVILVTPSTVVRETVMKIEPFITSATPVAMLSKGIERDTGLLLTDICEEVLGNRQRIAAISGPNHAEEVSKSMPSATVVASTSIECAEFFRDLFVNPNFRVYTSTDVCGVELCAASKNIIAIACGISAALGFGDNTAALIMTRGLAEMSRLTVALGGDPRTCMGLAGMGDLIATCVSKHSRNRSLGELIAAGGTLEQFTETTHMVAEGASAAITVTDLARRYDVELPIANVVRGILWEGRDLVTEIDKLLARSPKFELAGLDA